jgi:hypothetical protein
LTRLAAEYGITLLEGPADYKRKAVIDRDWLHEQYVDRGRTLPDLAREKNMSTANMARWAHHHQIPLRPRGGGSHDSALRTTDQASDLPDPDRQVADQPVRLAAAEPVRRRHRLPDTERGRRTSRRCAVDTRYPDQPPGT